jgi:hypothetical protein
MRRITRVAAGTSATFIVLLGLAPAAHADPSDDAVAALKNGSVYVGANTPKIDKGKLGGDLLNDDRGPIKVAIVPTGGPNPVSVAQSIGSRLDPNNEGVTVLVFEGQRYGAASTARCGVGTAIRDAVDAHRADLQSADDVTSTVTDFAATVRAAPKVGEGCSVSADNGGGNATQGEKSSDGGGSSHTALIVVLLLISALVAWVLYRRRSRRRAAERELVDARAQVMPFYDRLGHDVHSIKGGDNTTARQAMADAAERYSAAGAQLAAADSVEKFAQARRTALEGLYAARTARTALGLDPGPALPSFGGGGGEHLTRPQEVTVQGQSFQGYPDYRPGAPYYYGGGYGVPGGWYGIPFWETLLVGSMLTGGFGGFGGFGGGWGAYDAGYGTGYDAGYNAGEDVNDNGDAGGGGWGDSGGGGSWGNGGGWGDSGGGGDFGGGGGWGDSGGGDFGGGDFGGGDGGSW